MHDLPTSGEEDWTVQQVEASARIQSGEKFGVQLDGYEPTTQGTSSDLPGSCGRTYPQQKFKMTSRRIS